MLVRNNIPYWQGIHATIQNVMQEFLAFIDKVRAPTRESSHSALDPPC